MSELRDRFPAPDHDHSGCQREVLRHADQLCRSQGLRLTALRRRVLEIVCASHVPIGAYDIIEVMAGDGDRVAPMTVYRALDFLLAGELVHRLASLNAYIACSRPDRHLGSQFLICEVCCKVAEIRDPELNRSLRRCGSLSGFELKHPIVELQGVCASCRRAGNADHE